MYEKLCAILDALRERGISCRAECTYCSGGWEIVCADPIDKGMKVLRYPITYQFMDASTAGDLISLVLKEVLA